MRAKLTLSAAVVALLIIPTVTQTLAESLDSAGTRNSEAASAIPGLVEAPSVPLATPTQMTASGTMPSRGMTMAQVEQSHGVPMVRKAPVGNPPITRWEYEGFVVYFEYRHVIHSVTRVNR